MMSPVAVIVVVGEWPGERPKASNQRGPGRDRGGGIAAQ